MEDQILQIIRTHGPCYGLQIRDYLMAEGSPDPGGRLYSVLHQLERDGFLRSEERHEGTELRGGRPVYYYHLTGRQRTDPDATGDPDLGGGLLPA